MFPDGCHQCAAEREAEAPIVADIEMNVNLISKFNAIIRERDLLLEQRDRLMKALQDGIYAPSREPICVCGSYRNEVLAGTRRACWYCDARALLTEVEQGPNQGFGG